MLQRRRVLAGLVGLAGAGLLGLTTWRHTSLPIMAQGWRADHHTAIGETREVLLGDGTRVWLNTATAINQDFDPHQRRLHLMAGEILIDTASDPARPFLVDTPQGRMWALGTRFTVRLDDEHTLLVVYQGAVETQTHKGVGAVLQAGQQTRFSTNPPLDQMDSRFLVNAQAGIRRGRWELNLFAENLFDKHYYTMTEQDGSPAFAQVGPSRLYGVNVKAKF